MTTPQQESARFRRVGLVVALALICAMVFLFFIGSNQKTFARKNEYYVHLETVSGLAEGNPVQLSGVNVGTVKDIRLPRDPKNRRVEITISVDRKFEERIRGDSRARLKKLGLIAADSYIDITPGSPRYAVVAPGSLIPAAKQTNVDQLLGQGEDLVDNFVEISYSLKNILARVDRGEGLLGELTTEPKTKQRLTDTLMVTLNRTNLVLQDVQRGRGLVGKLLSDDAYAAEITGSLRATLVSLQGITGSLQRNFEGGDGALPALLSDPQGGKKIIELIENLRITSERLALFSKSLEEGDGIVPRLLNDEEYGDEMLREFQTLLVQLNSTARKLNEGEGTAGRLISDPAIYESINDILIGINESRALRWLIRNRQQKGIETRFKNEQKAPPASAPPAPTSRITAPKPPVIPVVVEPEPAEPMLPVDSVSEPPALE